MSEPTVTLCPKCHAEGKVRKTMHEDAWMPRTFVNIEDYKCCPLCEGSGIVFVVPAIVIGPAPTSGGNG